MRPKKTFKKQEFLSSKIFTSSSSFCLPTVLGTPAETFATDMP